MQWEDDGIIIWRSSFGERGLTVSLLTCLHGLHSGLVRCGSGGVVRGGLQLGNLLSVRWSARLSEHLGVYLVEVMDSYSTYIMQGRGVLLALNSLVSLLRMVLPERQPMPLLYARTHALVRMLVSGADGDGDNFAWVQSYCLWELLLLEELGYGLDMGSCALGGDVGSLAFVSPRTGRSASYERGLVYGDRLMRLPKFLRLGVVCDDVCREDLSDALRLTGFFLEGRILGPLGRSFSGERFRLLELFV